MGKLINSRMPYEPEPFAEMKSKHIKEFLANILEE